jgi:hypothetical protein
MSLRFYICPVIGDGLSEETAQRPKLHDYVVAGAIRRMSCIVKTDPDGKAQFPWTAGIARATDWSALDADPEMVKLFDTADLPDSMDTFAELKAYLQSRTVANIGPARRRALNARLGDFGIDTSGVTLQTTWWNILRGIYRHLNEGLDIVTDGPRA